MAASSPAVGFRRFLSGQKLNISDTRSFFKEVTLEKDTAIFILGLKYGLNAGILDPDLSMIQLIDITQNRTSTNLLPIAECLRYGANPNMYVDAPGLSNHIHILAYTFDKIRGSPGATGYPDTLIALLIFAGSDLNRPVFDSNFGGIRKESDYFNPQTSERNVAEWIYQQGYIVISEYQQRGLNAVIPAQQIQLLNILMDRAANLPKSTSRAQNHLYIKSLGNQILEKITPMIDEIYFDNSDLRDCVLTLNAPAFKVVVKAGIVPSFPLINEILLLTRIFKNQQYFFAMEATLDMIQTTVDAGVELSSDQRLLLSGISDKIISQISGDIKRPYWERTCSTSGKEVPLRLAQLAVELNIPPDADKNTICGRLRELAKKDPQELKAAAIRRSQERMRAASGFIDDYITPSPSGMEMICENRALIKGDPADYSDIDISYYRNSAGRMYCYTSDQYASLLETKVSPETREPLPASFLNELQFKTDLMKKLQLSARPRTISESIDELTKEDTLNSEIQYYWEPLRNKVLGDLEKAGISKEKFNSITTQRFAELLRRYGINGNLEKLTPSHARDTFIWILDWFSNNNTGIYSGIVSQL